MQSIIELIEASKRFISAAGRFEALKPVSLSFETGGYVGILGPSGSGKSTLLNLIAGIDRASSGRIEVNGEVVTGMPEGRLSAFRGRQIGIVFQFFQLIPTLTARENVRLAMDLVGQVKPGERDRRSDELLAQVGLEGHRDKVPAALSGGEQQRVAIARALANDPPVLLADEPTGNLDSVNSDRIEGIFRDCARSGRTVLVATHDTTHLDAFDRLIRINDGVVESDRNNGQ